MGMRAAASEQAFSGQTPRAWVPLAIGLLALYVPTYLDLEATFWRTRDGSYGAVMFLLIVWLIWRERDVLRAAEPPAGRAVGAILLGIGLLAYVLGRSQYFYQLEVGSQLAVLFGLALMTLGKTAVQRLSLPLCMLVFIIPVPGSLVDQLLLPLKVAVSGLVDDILHFFGYPIARSGVALLIGPYALLVADACSGLNSMVALSGIGLAYVHLASHTRRALNIVLLLSVLPIAFLANILRVLALVLVTYYGGDAAGAALHDVAAYLEILVAFGAFFLLDLGLTRAYGGQPQPRAPRSVPENAHAWSAPSGSVAGASAMLLAVLLAWWLAPTAAAAPAPRLAQIVPTAFQDWREIKTEAALVDPTVGTGATRDPSNPYDDVLMRAYANSRGEVVLLALAYGRNQRQELKIHRPELCYLAQGFSLLSRNAVTFPSAVSDLPVDGERMLVQSAGRVEAVSYWIRIGGMYSRSAWATRYYIFAQGLRRRNLDGILVRVSQILDTPASVSVRRYELQERFATDLVRALPLEARRMLVVEAGSS